MRGVGQLVERLDECTDARLKCSVCAAVTATGTVRRRGLGYAYVLIVFPEKMWQCVWWHAILCFGVVVLSLLFPFVFGATLCFRSALFASEYCFYQHTPLCAESDTPRTLAHTYKCLRLPRCTFERSGAVSSLSQIVTPLLLSQSST